MARQTPSHYLLTIFTHNQTALNGFGALPLDIANGGRDTPRLATPDATGILAWKDLNETEVLVGEAPYYPRVPQ